MSKQLFVALTLSFLAALVSGCANKGSDVRANANFQPGQTIFVEHLPADERAVDLMIVENLRQRGFTAMSGDSVQAPADTAYILAYQDNWMWDITMYMIRLNIQIRDRSGVTVATADSYRPSLQRLSPEEMIDETLDEIFAKSNPALVTPEMGDPDSKATRTGGRSTAGQAGHEF